MVDKFVTPLLALSALLLFNLTVRADALTFYTDKSAWLAAVSGDGIGVYSNPITETDTLVTIGTTTTSSGPVLLGSTTVITHQIGLSSLFYDFARTGQLFDALCVGGLNPCTVTGTADQVIITFSRPILGLGADAIINGEDVSYFINGQPLPSSISGRFAGGGSYDGFFGIVDPIKNIVFQCSISLSCALTDDIETMDLTNIIAATVSETTSVACLITALSLLGLIKIPSLIRRANRRSPSTVWRRCSNSLSG